VKLADFGMSQEKRNTRTLQTGVRGMTYSYSAPEMMMEQKFSLASDVFSFGICLYELFTLREPWDFPSTLPIMSLLFAICTQNVRPKIPADMPAPTQKLLTACWDKDPGRRPTMDHVIQGLMGLPPYELPGYGGDSGSSVVSSSTGAASGGGSSGASGGASGGGGGSGEVTIQAELLKALAAALAGGRPAAPKEELRLKYEPGAFIRARHPGEAKFQAAGVVAMVDNMTYKLQFADSRVHPTVSLRDIVLFKLGAREVCGGEIVRVRADKRVVEEICRSTRAGWDPEMEKIVNQPGIVEFMYTTDIVHVKFSVGGGCFFAIPVMALQG